MSFKFNPLTGQLDIAGKGSVINKADNFSLKIILSGSKKTIPATQQMLLNGTIEIDGDLVIDGSLVEISDEVGPLPHELVPPHQNVLIQRFQVLPFFTAPFLVDGNLTIDGHLLEIPQ
jgi:hypothetical protein